MTNLRGLAGLALSMLVLAGPSAADPLFDACLSGASADVNQCGEAWLKREQAAVDAKWQEIIGQTDGGVADTLAVEQTLWGEYRDASCAFMRDTAFAPGGDLTSFYKCRAGVISDRLKEIEVYARYVDN